MPDYQLGKIYKIESHQTDKIYIGSTCEKYLSNRLGGHKKQYTFWKKGKGHLISSFEIMKYDDAFITLIEAFPCNSKYELEARERYWIEQLNCINKVIPTRSRKEHYQENKDVINERNNIYFEKNKEEVMESKKKYYQNNKVKILSIKKENREKNKEKNREIQRRYREQKKRIQENKLFIEEFAKLDLFD